MDAAGLMKRDFDRREILAASAIFVAGLVLRLRLASITYLNPDEALHALASFGPWGEVFRQSIRVAHPPLLIAATHTVSLISRAELALRLIPVLAGSLFPVLLSAWLRRMMGRVAGMTALLLLTLAPHLVTVSAELRSYTLALFWLSASLIALEKALETGRWQAMALYDILLWLCILSDFSMAWFAGAAGFYALLRLRGTSTRAKATWITGQLVTLALYGLLFLIQVRHYLGGGVEQEAVSGWLRGAFPQQGSMIAFPFVNTLKQFAYLAASLPLGVLAMALFAVAVFWLWTERTAIQTPKARALAVLLVSPFVLALAGAYAHLFPYGRSRHTLVLGLFGAVGIAIFLEAIPHRVAKALLCAALLLAPLWHRTADRDQQEIDDTRNRKEFMLQSLDYMRATIPEGARIFTERETLLMLAYYEGLNRVPVFAGKQFSETLLGGRWRVAVKDYKYTTTSAYRDGLEAFRRRYGLGEAEPVGVLDGGWDVVSGHADETRPFTRAVRIFQAGSP